LSFHAQFSRFTTMTPEEIAILTESLKKQQEALQKIQSDTLYFVQQLSGASERGVTVRQPSYTGPPSLQTSRDGASAKSNVENFVSGAYGVSAARLSASSKSRYNINPSLLKPRARFSEVERREGGEPGDDEQLYLSGVSGVTNISGVSIGQLSSETEDIMDECVSDALSIADGTPSSNAVFNLRNSGAKGSLFSVHVLSSGAPILKPAPEQDFPILPRSSTAKSSLSNSIINSPFFSGGNNPTEFNVKGIGRRETSSGFRRNVMKQDSRTPNLNRSNTVDSYQRDHKLTTTEEKSGKLILENNKLIYNN
jgi:hypothetical protein